MILRIAALLGECPQSRTTARAAAVTIATGFNAIGANSVILIAAALPLLAEAACAGFLGASGFAALCLGLGFTHAGGALRAIMFNTRDKAPVTAAA